MFRLTSGPAGSGAAVLALAAMPPAGSRPADEDLLAVDQHPGEVERAQVDPPPGAAGLAQRVDDPRAGRQRGHARAAHLAGDVDGDARRARHGAGSRRRRRRGGHQRRRGPDGASVPRATGRARCRRPSGAPRRRSPVTASGDEGHHQQDRTRTQPGAAAQGVGHLVTHPAREPASAAGRAGRRVSTGGRHGRRARRSRATARRRRPVAARPARAHGPAARADGAQRPRPPPVTACACLDARNAAAPTGSTSRAPVENLVVARPVDAQLRRDDRDGDHARADVGAEDGADLAEPRPRGPRGPSRAGRRAARPAGRRGRGWPGGRPRRPPRRPRPPRPRAPPAGDSALAAVRTFSNGPTRPSSTLRIGLTASADPTSAAAAPIRPPRRRYSRVST